MKKDMAAQLLKIEAVELRPDDPFTWTSGIKSPIYCDNRMTLSFPDVRRKVAEGLEALVKEHYPNGEVLAGTATAGIPHAAIVAERLNLPMIYVRGKTKSHGKENKIEGLLRRGQQVVIVEDLISTGGSVINVAQALREAGANVLGVVAIFTYGLTMGVEQLAEANLETYTLTDYETLIETAVEMEYVGKESMEKLRRWKENPKTEHWLAI